MSGQVQHVTLGDGCRLAYRFDGREDAPVLLLSNSLGTRMEMWDAQMAAFSAHFRVLRYDSRGHGASDAPAGGVNNGDAYNYSIQVNNYGPTALSGGGFARVTFQVPAGAPVPSAGVIGGAGWTCSPASGPVAATHPAR